MVYESIAETYMRNRDMSNARLYLTKAKALDPENPHWEFMRSRLKSE